MSKLRVAYVLAYSSLGALFAVVSCSPATVSKPAGIDDTAGTGAGAAAGVGAGAAAGVGAGAAAGVGAGAAAGVGAGAAAGVGAGAAAGVGAGAAAGVGAGAAAGVGAGAAAGVGAGGAAGTAGAGTAGTAGSAGAAGTPAVCPTDPNVVNTPSPACWVGCDPALSTDNPQGVQGAFYGFGDGMTCPAMGVSPICTVAKGVCMSGTTKVDSTYAAWGCGLGLELNSTGGTTPMKQLYAGPATCFDYTLTGDSGGNEVRIAFTQKADTSGVVSPYISIPSITGSKSGTVCLKDVSCQGQTLCSPITGNGTPFDIQFTVAGGNHAGAFNLCLTSLTPKGTGSSSYTQICGAVGSAAGREDVGKYFAQNNVNNDPSGSLCLTPGLSGTNASFNIDSANLHDPGSAPAAYPSIVDGWHYGMKSSDTALPKAVSAIGSVQSSAAFSGSSGKYDAAYDIWVLPANGNPATPAGGLEIMIWLSYSGVQPSGARLQGADGTYNNYEVWGGTVSSWKYIAYRASGMSSFNGDLLPFIKNAITKSGLGGTPYLSGIEFGFELWSGGQGMKVTSFNATVN